MLAGEYYQSKSNAKDLFYALKIPTPISISLRDTNHYDFFRDFVKMILTYKTCNKWMLKLPNSTFSRGLALLETESLKIIK